MSTEAAIVSTADDMEEIKLFEILFFACVLV